ncbi:MAG TPA: A24 family peptidase [Woeseiaceae bacterium]|nr:A24 family peptidase [Woeseiaceae bacterium]
MTLSHFAAIGLVTAAAFFDIARHRIPNLLTYPSWALGLALGAYAAGMDGMTNAALGFAAGFFPLLLMFMSGSLGGGDVKLMGGVGALLGFPAGLNALISSILVGGFFAAIILLWQGRLIPILKYAASRLWSKVWTVHVPLPAPPEHKDAFPFGVAIALGTYLTLISIQMGAQTPNNLFS